MPKKLTAALLALLCGCSTTATISRKGGPTVEAKIQRSDREYLFVKTEDKAEAVIPRAEVADIDHPGNATAVLGGLLSAYGVLNIVSGLETCSESEGAVGVGYCTGMVLPAAVGAGMLIWGLTTWGNSLNAAGNNTSPAYTGVVPSPPSTSPFDFTPARGRGSLSALGTH